MGSVEQTLSGMAAANARFDPKLESLRGLASLAVMVSHCFWFYMPPSLAMFDTWQGWLSVIPHAVMNGNSAVVLFFVLSGYVLAIQWSGQPSYAAFVVRRIFRLTPTMWLACLLAFAVALVIGALSWADYPVLLWALAYQSPQLSGPLWTIIAEMWCSLAFPLFYVLHRRSPVWVQIVCLLVLTRLMYTGLFPPLAGNLVYFYLGALVHSAGTRFVGRMLLGLALILYMLPALAPIYGLPIEVWRLTSGVAAFVILSNVVHGGRASLLDWPVVRFLGRVSYGAYLFHFSFLLLVVNAWAGAPWPLLSQIVLAAVVVPSTLVAAALSHRYVEAPMNRFGRFAGAKLARAEARYADLLA